MKKRIISAIIMLLIVIPIVWYGKSLFCLGVAIVSLLALKEIFDLPKSHKQFPMPVKIISMICLLLLVLTNYHDSYSIMFGITYRGLAIMLLSLLGLTLFYKKDEYPITDAFFLIGTILLLGTSFNTMIFVRMFEATNTHTGLYMFTFLILIFILTDTFAYLGGRTFGKHKLIPHVSPNKTIEGSIIGTVIATIGASVFYHYLLNPLNYQIVLGIIFLSILGQIGDLIFSKIKRENEIKDFSNLIPGHGGILDRLDSTIAIMLGYLIIYSIF